MSDHRAAGAGRARTERAAIANARAAIGKVIAALGLDHPLGVLCPCCDGFRLQAERCGRRARCRDCGVSFGAVELVRQVKDLSTLGACDFLEEMEAER